MNYLAYPVSFLSGNFFLQTPCEVGLGETMAIPRSSNELHWKMGIEPGTFGSLSNFPATELSYMPLVLFIGG